MTNQEREKLYQEFDTELEQVLLDCCDSMDRSEVHDLLDSTKDRLLFSIGYLKDYKCLHTFFYYILKGERDMPF